MQPQGTYPPAYEQQPAQYPPPPANHPYAPGHPAPVQTYVPAYAPAPPSQTNISNNNNNSNTISNTVVVNQPGASSGNNLLLIPKDKIQSRSWTTGLCGCLDDCTSCIIGCVCLPGLMARVSNRLGECCLLGCLVPGSMLGHRTKVRTLGGIKGSIWSDFVVTWCCLPCAVCQMSREMDAMGL